MYKRESKAFYNFDKIDEWINNKGEIVSYKETRVYDTARGNGVDVVVVFKEKV